MKVSPEERLFREIFGNKAGKPLSQKKVAAFRLLGLVEQLSEKHYCAGWASWCELELWETAQCHSRRGVKWGQATIPFKTCLTLRKLAKACGGWWIHGETSRKYYKKTKESRVFIPTIKWEVLYARLRPNVRKLSPREFAEAINKKFEQMEARSK